MERRYFENGYETETRPLLNRRRDKERKLHAEIRSEEQRGKDAGDQWGTELSKLV